MLPVVLVVLAALFVVLAFVHVVSLLVGLGIALALLIALVVLGNRSRWL